MLPNSAGVAVTFFALQSIGRVPAMINFTAGAANIKAACRAAKVRSILTSRAFVEKARLQPLVGKLEQPCASSTWRTCGAGSALRDKIAGLLAGTDGARGTPGPTIPA